MDQSTGEIKSLLLLERDTSLTSDVGYIRGQDSYISHKKNNMCSNVNNHKLTSLEILTIKSFLSQLLLIAKENPVETCINYLLYYNDGTCKPMYMYIGCRYPCHR